MRRARVVVPGVALAFALAVAGCAPEKPDQRKDAAPKKDKAGHDHGEGPHGGTVADWGKDGKYHVEFTVDHDKKEATVYVLGGNGRSLAPIKADKLLLKIKEPAFEVELKPKPQDKDPEGKCSRFVGTHAALGKEQEFEGEISADVEGKQYSGTFKEEPPKKK